MLKGHLEYFLVFPLLQVSTSSLSVCVLLGFPAIRINSVLVILVGVLRSKILRNDSLSISNRNLKN